MNAEIERLRTLIEYGIMDTHPEKQFDELATLVSIVCGTPTALISFIDDKRQWYKARIGIETTEEPIQNTICQYTLLENDVLEITNTLHDERLKNNPHVQTPNGIRYYIGAPIVTSKGLPIGTVCAVDNQPRKPDLQSQQILKIISSQVMQLVDMEYKNKQLVTELKQVLEQKLEGQSNQIKLSQTAYNSLFHAISISNAVAEFTTEGVFLSANKQFTDMLEYSEAELIGQHHNILLDVDDKKKNNEFWDILGKGSYKSGRFKRLSKTGKTIWIQASYSPVKDTTGKIIRIHKIAQNITAEIEQQQETERAKKLADTLNIQKDTFLTNMSHEIRTPLNAIIGYTELLLETETKSQIQRYIQSIKHASDDLLYLINDILDLSKLEAGILQIDKKDFELQSVIEHVFSVLLIKAKQKQLAFEFVIHKNVLPVLNGDKNRLTQILINLLGNAIKFTEHGSVKLEVACKSPDENPYLIEFTVSDTGIGIPPEKLQTVFERFAQAEEDTTRKFGGTGLGLTISKQLVEKQFGSIRVQSELGKGSEFIFTIQFEKPDKKSAPRKTGEQVDYRNRFAGASILLCEDNEMNRQLAQEMFKSTKWELDMAVNGKDAIERLNHKSYDLILMDIQMPEMDGYQTTQWIRNEKGLDTPIIALTAHSMVKEEKKCLALGMNAYLSKPFKKAELFEKITYLLNEKQPLLVETQPTPSLETEIINLSTIADMSGGNTDFQNEMLDLFKKQSVESIHEIASYLQDKQYQAASEVVHKLKSSCGILNADLTLLEELETRLKKNKTDKMVPELFTKLQQQIERINQYITSYLNPDK